MGQEPAKTCFKCEREKPLSEYYKHKKMADGHLNKCKACTRKDVKERADDLSKNPEWVAKEQARHREKYHRLGYKEKHKPTAEQKRQTVLKYKKRYPEKERAKSASQKLRKKIQGIDPNTHLHHWSYNEEHFEDVIMLPKKLHYTLHRYLEYVQERKIYKTIDGELLDARAKHEKFIQKLISTQ